MCVIKRMISAVVSLAMMSTISVAVFAGGSSAPLVQEIDLSTAVPAKSYILMEASTGKVLAQQNADEQMAPASITKIMVMLLLMERLDAGQLTLEDMVTTSEHANSMGGTQIWLEVGETMSIHDLLKATAVNSANDASVALAEHMAGTEEAFVALMNQRAAELGMVNTVFKNATGLDADGHLSTSHDIALMSAELIKHEKIKEYSSIWMDSLRDGTTSLVNTNKMVRYYDGCNGLKTGTTDDAGSCLSSTATRDNMTLISVSMGSTTSKERFDAARTLLDYGFAGYSLYTPTLNLSDIPPIKLSGGQKEYIDINMDPLSSLVIAKGTESTIEQTITVDEDLHAPIEQGQVVGTVTYTQNGEVIAEMPIQSTQAIDTMNFPFAFSLLVRMLFGLY